MNTLQALAPLRRMRGVKVREVAKVLEVSSATVSKAQRGLVSHQLSRAQCTALASLLSVSEREVIAYEVAQRLQGLASAEEINNTASALWRSIGGE